MEEAEVMHRCYRTVAVMRLDAAGRLMHSCYHTVAAMRLETVGGLPHRCYHSVAAMRLGELWECRIVANRVGRVAHCI